MRLENICFYRENTILENISFDFQYNRIYGLIGKSGEGKTTLLKLMSGLLNLDKGSIFLDNDKIVGPNQKLVPGYDEIQLVQQDFNLDLFHTVEENIKGKILSRTKDVQQELIEEMLELVELSHLRNKQSRFLSGGEQQRLSIARAIACEPKVLLLDEPFVHLDQRIKWKILDYLNNLTKSRQILIVIASHDGAELMGFVDMIIHLKDASFKRVDTPKQMFFFPNTIEQAELMGEINRVKIGNKTILFRPVSYHLNKKDIQVSFIGCKNLGNFFRNEFKTKQEETLILYSSQPLTEIKEFGILDAVEENL